MKHFMQNSFKFLFLALLLISFSSSTLADSTSFPPTMNENSGLTPAMRSLSPPEAATNTPPTTTMPVTHPALSGVTRPATEPSTEEKPSESRTVVAKVIWVKGSFFAISPNNIKRPLNKNEAVYLKDTLSTEAKTQAQIVFSDNSLMTFKENSKLLIDEYAYQPKKNEKSVGKYVMNLITGGFRTITGLIAKSNPDDYAVKTPVATIGVRGTDYTVNLDTKGLFVGNMEGTTSITNMAGTIEVSKQSNQPYASVASASSAPTPLSERPAELGEPIIIKQEVYSPPATPSGDLKGNFCIHY